MKSTEPTLPAPVSPARKTLLACTLKWALVVGILGPLGVSNWMEDSKHFAWTLGNPIIKLYFIVLCFFTFVHAGHRLRYALYDLGIRNATRALEWVCYGLAVVGTLVAAALLVTTP